MSDGPEQTFDAPERSAAGAGRSSDLDETWTAEDSVHPRPRPRISEPAPGERIGRYVVLSKLGAGGMGIVLGAYDPELDRKVALKLLRVRGHNQALARARLQREAQALAQLNHPNVVTVYDVGAHGGLLFVAMELVPGQTLGEWIESSTGDGPRPWREVVTRMEAAGQGLAAAHAVGLVHRDFKPDNVMLGEDGRVRVMDFGLARAHAGEPDSMEDAESSAIREARLESSGPRVALTHVGAMLGTPAYMAPEQFAGGRVTARTDQFAFCVTLYEGLYGTKPFEGETPAELAYSVMAGELRSPPRSTDVPAWLWRLVRRGLAVDPQERFESMAELLGVLGSAAARRRRSRILGAASVVVLGIAGIVGGRHYEQARREAECVAEGDAIDEVWNGSSREAVRAGLVATGVGNAPTVAEKIMPWIDAQAQVWREQATAACTWATVDERWTPRQHDKAKWCLEQRKGELSILLAELAHADEGMVQEAGLAVVSLPLVETCTDDASLASLPASSDPELGPRVASVRESLLRVDAMIGTGQYDDAVSLARQAEERAVSLAWLPLIAEAKQRKSTSLLLSGAYEESEQVAVEAYMAALRSGTWHVAAKVATELVGTIGYHQARHAEALVWAEHAAACIVHAGDPLGLREAERASEVGRVYRAKGEYAEAEAWYQEALARTEAALGPKRLQSAAILNNMALVSMSRGDQAQARERLEQALEIRERTLGRDHPGVGTVHNNLGKVHERAGNWVAARAAYTRARETLEQALGPEHPHVAGALSNLGTVQWMLEEDDDAERNLERALAIQEAALGADHPDLASTHNSLGQLYRSLDRNAEAQTHYERALALWEHSLGPQHPYVATGLGNLGRLRLKMGAHEDALAMLTRALTIREEALGPDHLSVATNLLDLGDVHLAMGAHEDARDAYARALAIQQKVLGSEDVRLADAVIGLGKAQLTLGQPQAAVELLERAVRLRSGADAKPMRLAESRFALARALVAMPEPPLARARELAEQARDGYAAEGAQEAEAVQAVAEIEQWLAEHPEPTP